MTNRTYSMKKICPRVFLTAAVGTRLDTVRSRLISVCKSEENRSLAHVAGKRILFPARTRIRGEYRSYRGACRLEIGLYQSDPRWISVPQRCMSVGNRFLSVGPEVHIGPTEVHID
ncbi:hypothetical protein J6590_078893 [Homalodisca vitripennis]|nr:hypothetical protein J6590_078893 [Homalodisca vitripennis]